LLRSLQVLEYAGSFRFDIEKKAKIEASFRLRFDIVAFTSIGIIHTKYMMASFA
jgi:hypothetical protein